MSKEITKKKETIEPNENQKALPFGKQNFIIVLIGLALIALGFILMIGGGSTDPDVSNASRWHPSWSWLASSWKS